MKQNKDKDKDYQIDKWDIILSLIVPILLVVAIIVMIITL